MNIETNAIIGAALFMTGFIIGITGMDLIIYRYIKKIYTSKVKLS